MAIETTTFYKYQYSYMFRTRETIIRQISELFKRNI